MPNFEYNFPENQFNLISGSADTVAFGQNSTEYARLVVTDEFNSFVGEFTADQSTFAGGTSFIYSGSAGSHGVFINANDVLQASTSLDTGTYNLKFDFLDRTELSTYYKFYIKEISPSRKEVRIIARTPEGVQILIDQDIDTPTFNDILEPTGEYLYDFVLTLSEGRNIPILNYAFDDAASIDENVGTLVLRLSQVLPSDINQFDRAHVEREVLTTQTQEIFFVPDPNYSYVIGEPGPSLDFDDTFPTGDTVDIAIQSYDDIVNTGSLARGSIINKIISGSYLDENLNIDHAKFGNHVFFGSAESKLENFRDKVITIENYLTEISASLKNSDGQFLLGKELISTSSFDFPSADLTGLGYANAENVWSASGFTNANEEAKIEAGKLIITSTGTDDLDHVIQKITGTNFGTVIGKEYLLDVDIDSLDTIEGVSANELTWSISDVGETNTLYGGSELPSSQLSGSWRFVWDEGDDIEIKISATGSLKLNSVSLKNVLGTMSSNQVTSKRKELFGKIQNTVDTFTPYERFLYHDNQSYSTGSAPGLGTNYADTTPISKSIEDLHHRYALLNGFDGFDITHRLAVTGSLGDKVGIFSDKYFAEQKPFFNYSGSLYLSFLLKAPLSISGPASASAVGPGPPGFRWDSAANLAPSQSLYTGSLLSPPMTGSEYRRFILQASRSYWRPSDSRFGVGGIGIRDGDDDPTDEVRSVVLDGTDDTKFEILSSSKHVQSASGIPAGNSAAYPIVVYDKWRNLASSMSTGSFSTDWNPNEDVADSSPPFTGSILPSGELFNIFWKVETDPSEVDVNDMTSSFFTDVKITTKNPMGSQGSHTDTLPFSNLYVTDSTEWQDWYSGMQASASAYDNNNIHSFVNNLPVSIRFDTTSDDLKSFINMLGEKFDVIKNYIDNYLNIHNRNYKSRESVPNNLLPIITKNFGWDLISPFDDNLSAFFGNSDDYLFGESATKESITNNTWRKILNNLIYIYKTKGTLASVRAILNIFGYPGDLITVSEFGSALDPVSLGNTNEGLPEGLTGIVSNTSFVSSTENIRTYTFGGTTRILSTDWVYNDVNADGFGFLLRSSQVVSASKRQSIIASSGSAEKTLWDLSLVSTGSTAAYWKKSKLEFRLNNSYTGSSDITASAVSMSTGYLDMSRDNSLWTVWVQRMTSSISGTGTQEYKMYTARKMRDSIFNLTAVSMSISGGRVNSYITGSANMTGSHHRNYYANQNWITTGSRHKDSGSNLIIGKNYTGSMAFLNVWSGSLSSSVFKETVLNPSRAPRNRGDKYGYKKIYYSLAFQDGYDKTDPNPKVADITPKTGKKSFDISLSRSIFSEPTVVYDTIQTKTYQFSPETGGTFRDENKVKITKGTDDEIIRNLSPDNSSIKIIRNKDFSANTQKNLSRIDIAMSPTTEINKLILNKISGYPIMELFGDPADVYESSYGALEKFREELLDTFNVSIEMKKYIDSKKDIFNSTLIDAIQKVLPARATLGNIGVVLEPNILDRPKFQYNRASVEYGAPGIKRLKDSIDAQPILDGAHIDIKASNTNVLLDTVGLYVDAKTANTDIELNLTSTYYDQKITTISLPIETIASYTDTKTSNILLSIETDASYVGMKTGSISLPIETSSSYVSMKTSNILLPIETDASYTDTKTSNISLPIETAALYVGMKTGSISLPIETSSSYTSMKISNISLPIETSANYTTYEATKISAVPTQTAAYIEPYSGSLTWASDRFYRSFVNTIDLWGTSSNDTHFVNKAWDASSSLDGPGDPVQDSFKNVNHHESDYAFEMVGDLEIQSGSFTYSPHLPALVDHTDIRIFGNRKVVDKGKGHTYKSYVKVGGDVEGPQDGRPVGKTSYYVTKSDGGNLHYPSNHWARFSADPFTMQMFKGSICDELTFQSTIYEDYTSSCAYTVRVEEVDELRPVRGVGSITADGKVKYPKQP